MKGTIKWFSTDKGYGFITGNDNQDRYFHVQAIVGSELPNPGDIVTFTEEHHK